MKQAVPRPVPVGVGIVLYRSRSSGRTWVLVSHRFPVSHLPDLWEFPGGKTREGEDSAACVRREVEEETGVQVRVRGLLMAQSWTYDGRLLALEFHLCEYVSGTPQAIGCQAVRWVLPDRLDTYPFPAGSHAVVRTLLNACWG